MRREYHRNTGGNLPEGVLPGTFSISDTKKVHFSKGNLYCDHSDGATYKFALENNQYDYRTRQGKGCCINGVLNTSSGSPAGMSGLFAWDSNSASPGKDYGAFFTGTSLSSRVKNLDWGTALGDIWSTLSRDEFDYLLLHHDYGIGVTVEGISGVVIVPEDYPDTIDSSYTFSSWKSAEKKGAVFFPYSGQGYGSTVSGVNSVLNMWTSTSISSYASAENASYVYAAYTSSFYVYDGADRANLCCVRLVYPEPDLE